MINNEFDKNKLDENEIKLDENEIKLDENEIKLDENEIKLDENEVKLDENEVKLDENEVKLDENEVKLKYELEKQNKYYSDKILRLKAELDNVYKRNSIEIEKIYKFSLEKFFIELLPVIDNLERTINEFNNENIDINIIKEGIELTLKLFIKIINKFGISSINDINIPFNPNIHQAVITLNDESFPSNHVIKIMQKGYLLHKKLIRPAMVQVSLNKNSDI